MEYLLAMCTDFNQQQLPEPLWTWREKEKFWNIVEPYLLQLLTEQIPLPVHDIDFSCMETSSRDDQLFCYRLLRNEMWFGKYSMAVANYKAMREFFSQDVGFENCKTESDLNALKQLFMERSLERSNVKWIEKHTQSFECGDDYASSLPDEESYPSR